MSPYPFYALASAGKIGNHPLAIGILCREDAKVSVGYVLERMCLWVPPETYDPLLLDQAMTDEMNILCSENVVAAGMSLCAWRYGPSAGGVIGAPRKLSSTADGELEELDENVWCCAYSGGPGFVVCGSKKQALTAQQIITGFRNQHMSPWQPFKKWLGDELIVNYLYVSDGSGEEGLLSVGGKNGATTFSLSDL